MNKELIFSEMVENILSRVTLSGVNAGELIADKDTILIKVESQSCCLAYVPYELNGESIHGNTRNALAKEFIKLYSVNDLKKLYNEKIEIHNKHIQLEEQNKYKLDELYKTISYLEKYNNNNRYNFNGGVKFIYGATEKYCIEFSFSKDNWSSDKIQIYNNNDYTSFDFRFNYQPETLPAEEVIKRIESLVPKYELIYNEKQALAEAKKLEEERKQQLEKKISELYWSKDVILLKNSKGNSFTRYKNGMRYAVGTGKSGKYYNCSYSQFHDLITKKNINEYCIIDPELKVYGLKNEELKNNFEYIKMIG